MTETREIVVADVGGTHARFAIARVGGGGVLDLGPETVIATAAHASLEAAWARYGETMHRTLPRAAGIAIASPIGGDVICMTNSQWAFRPAAIGDHLQVDSHVLLNDFEAVAHAVAQAPAAAFRHVCGPDRDLPERGVITIVGPGTGLGIALLHRVDAGYHVVPTEGGHVDFAPTDAVEDAILTRLRARHGRVSVERIVSGPGLAHIHAALAGDDGAVADNRALWSAALAGSDGVATEALERFCQALGGCAGDAALAQGAVGVVIAGGLGLRLADHLPDSGFARRFVAKGRFAGMMNAIPVKLVTHPQPGLFGAAAAYARRFAA